MEERRSGEEGRLGELGNGGRENCSWDALYEKRVYFQLVKPTNFKKKEMLQLKLLVLFPLQVRNLLDATN